MIYTDYRLKKQIYTVNGQYADAICVNQAGEWLAEFDAQTQSAYQLTDEDGYYIPAPPNWRELIEK